MTFEMWTPFALLFAVCAVYPRPAWTRRVDWFRVGGYLACLGFCLSFWTGVGFLAWWVA